MFDLAPPTQPRSFKSLKETISSITLSWIEPDSDGGAPVTGYVLRVNHENDEGDLVHLDGDVLHYTVTKLKAGMQYHFTLHAENDKGQSEEFAEISASTKSKASELVLHVNVLYFFFYFLVFRKVC